MQQLVFSYPHNVKRSSHNFFVSDSNQQTVNTVLNWQNWDPSYFVLEGGPASGKTHLLELWREKSNAIDLPQFFSPVKNNYALDDADKTFAGAGQTELFHWLNFLQGEGGALLMTCSQPVGEWVTLPDLASRLKAAPHGFIEAPDDKLMDAAFKKMFADRQIQIDDNVLSYLLPRIERSLSSAHDLVEKLDEISLQSKRRITIDLARSLFK